MSLLLFYYYNLVRVVAIKLFIVIVKSAAKTLIAMSKSSSPDVSSCSKRHYNIVEILLRDFFFSLSLSSIRQLQKLIQSWNPSISRISIQW